MTKKRVLFINSVCGFGSTGRIVEDLARTEEYETLVCYGRKKYSLNAVKSYRFTSFFDVAFGAFKSIVFDDNLNICKRATKKLISKIDEFNPDIIHIHNLHGYYINVSLLFDYLKKSKKYIIWTFHDCWPFTGYCPNFDYCGCDKYKTKCVNCKHDFSYPFSLFKQKTGKNFEIKKKLYSNMDMLTIVTPSNWLAERIKESFLSSSKIFVINNGIETKRTSLRKEKIFSIIAVANYWTKEKGINELKKIVPLINNEIKITIVGRINNKKGLEKCELIDRVDNVNYLQELYSKSSLFINPTLEDNFPTVNIEALSCGTPIITYNTGGSPEVINKNNGIVIEKYDYTSFANMINYLYKNYKYNPDFILNESKKYSRERFLKEYKRVYERILDNGKIKN